MSTDAESREAPAPRPDLWVLPEIIRVEIERRQFAEPRAYYAGRRRIEVKEAVEIRVRTSDEIKARAITPSLFVGDVALPEFETIGPNQYRFFAYEPGSLRDGAPIALGWPGEPEPRKESRFRYEAPAG
ncbi:MAG: hypothetical protein ACRDJW_03680 [Thermomicrobiales bacterium]